MHGDFPNAPYKDNTYVLFSSLRVVLYGCETWSVTLKEEHKLRVSENSVQREIIGPKRNEITGDWRRLHRGSFVICTKY
jgi:hypothetical protein